MNANVETKFAVTSSPGITMNAPRKEIGMPRLTQNASRSSVSNASTMNTSTNPVAPLRAMSHSRSPRTRAPFCQTVSEIPGGSVGAVRST